MPPDDELKRIPSRMPGMEGSTYLDLTSNEGRALVGYGNPAGGDPICGEELLALFPAMEAIRLFESEEAARDAAFHVARTATGRDEVFPLHNEADLGAIERTSGMAAVDIRPENFGPETMEVLYNTCRQLMDRGVLIVVDGTRSLFRTPAPLDQGDLLYVGESLAQGLAFGAVLCDGKTMDLCPDAGAVSPAALSAVRSVVSRLQEDPVAERIETNGQRLREAFEEACKSESLKARIEGSAGCLHIRFDDQIGLPSDRITSIFLEEMAKLGVLAGQRLYPSPVMTEQELHRACEAIRLSLSLTRKRMVESGSFFSGSLAFPFDRNPSLVKERGLALYRFPVAAAVDLCVKENGIKIRFEAGDLGEITSSGFWIPTWLVHDFSIRMRYAVHAWKPGDQPACFGMWIANRTTSFTCYAQRTTENPAPTRLGAVMGDRPLHHAAEAGMEAGEFRITREGKRIVTWHRAEGSWLTLAEIDQDDPEDMITGAKIWAHGKSGPLEVEVVEITIEATPSGNQDDPPPFQKDPRCVVIP